MPRRKVSVDEALKALIGDAQEFFFSELFLVALDLAIQGRLQEAADNTVGAAVGSHTSAGGSALAGPPWSSLACPPTWPMTCCG